MLDIEGSRISSIDSCLAIVGACSNISVILNFVENGSTSHKLYMYYVKLDVSQKKKQIILG